MSRYQTATRKPFDRRGSSLLEFILYFAVIGMILTAVIGFSAEFVGIHNRTAIRREISRDGRYAVARIAAEIRSAVGVNSGDSVFGSGNGRLSLAASNPSEDPTVFAVDGGRLAVSRGGGGLEPITSLSSAVGGFTVYDVSVPGRSRAFRIVLALESVDSSQGNVTVTFETTAQVRKGQGFPD
ncbi:hypothetical protein JW899_03085 [Candidatus Uhrbacteria bacterium]|nr:hypothetical protein [Candidatus Uhrbacteria bacterium]